MFDLKFYNNCNYSPGRTILIRVLWYFVSRVIFQSFLPYPSTLKSCILRLFGAKVGVGVVIKPFVKIKYPWLLSLGDHTWVGECVWIDNLAQVDIGNNCCLSQGAYLLTGNHDYMKNSFDLMAIGITIGDSVWVGAKSIVCPGVRLSNGAILTVGSILTKDAERDAIYQGNPAIYKKTRNVKL